MSITLNIPSNLTYYSIQSIIFDIKSLEEDNVVYFNLNNLNYIDPEGLNYIALMPFYLKLILHKNVIISLPQNESSISYLHFTGLLKEYFNNFQVEHYNCVEDAMFLKKTFKRSNHQKSRIGIITPKSFQSFLSNELRNVERLIENTELSNHFCFCFYELVKNIFQHSGEKVGGFSFHLKNGTENSLSLSIADIGIGIRNSIKKVVDFDDEVEDYLFIKEAIKEGISGTGKIGRGFGLSKIIEIIDYVQITSGSGQIITYEGKIDKENTINTNLKGTSIFLKLRI